MRKSNVEVRPFVRVTGSPETKVAWLSFPPNGRMRSHAGHWKFKKNEERIREEIRRGSTLSEVAELIKWEKK